MAKQEASRSRRTDETTSPAVFGGTGVKRTAALYFGGAALGLLLASVAAPPAQGNPAPAGLIRSVGVLRPSSAQLVAVPAAPLQRLERAEPAPVCDDDEPQSLLRAGCPEAAPGVLPCAAEGLECRYANAEGCVAHYECLYGLWSPRGVSCPELDPGEAVLGSGQCEERTPVADAPCTDEGLSCEHQPCGLFGAQLLAECRCGRWYQRWQDCPLTR
jgi:hypothetical protein